MATPRRRTWKTANGSLRVRWEYSYYLDGKQIKRGGFKTKSEAEAAYINEDRENKPLDNKNLTFHDAAEDFMILHAEIHCKESTLVFYASNIRKHLLPFFNNTKVLDIDTVKINEYIKVKIKEGLAAKTINHHLTLLQSILQRLVDADQITTNVARKVKRLKLPHCEMGFLNQDEIMVVLDRCKKDYPDFHTLLFLAIFTGMRKGELIALTWSDISFFSGKIRVNKAVYKNKLSSPKTHSSNRKIDIPKSLVTALKEHKLQQGGSELVFSNQMGNFLDPDNMIKRRFNPLLRKCGIEQIRFHDLRHTYASMLIAQNVPIKYIQAQMGHSSIQVTMDRYGHLMPEVGAQAVKVLDSMFEKGKNDGREKVDSSYKRTN